MRVLGIDPGTLVMGYGVIESRDDDITLVDYGILKTQVRSSIGERLSYLYNRLMKIISHYKPDVMAMNIRQPG